jgi:hypothetical protein
VTPLRLLLLLLLLLMLLLMLATFGYGCSSIILIRSQWAPFILIITTTTIVIIIIIIKNQPSLLSPLLPPWPLDARPPSKS